MSGISMFHFELPGWALWPLSCAMWLLCSLHRIQAMPTLARFQWVMFENSGQKLTLRMLQHIKSILKNCSSRWTLSELGWMESKIRLWVKLSKFTSNWCEWFKTSKGMVILNHPDLPKPLSDKKNCLTGSFLQCQLYYSVLCSIYSIWSVWLGSLIHTPKTPTRQLNVFLNPSYNTFSCLIGCLLEEGFWPFFSVWGTEILFELAWQLCPELQTQTRSAT